MFHRWLVFPILGMFAVTWSVGAQTIMTGSPAPPNKQTPPAFVSNLAPDAPVVTIDGVCSTAPWSIATPITATNPGSANSSSQVSTTDPNTCKLTITRAEFEKLSAVLAPTLPPTSAIQVARVYSDLLVSALKGHEAGVDKDPHFDDILKFTYVQVVARAMTQRIEKQANEAAEAEIDKYYKEHSREFEQVQLLQISIPKHKLRLDDSPPPPSAAELAAEEAAMKTEADQIHRRAVAGEEFDKLQDEAYTVAGNADAAPNPDAGAVTRSEVGQFQDLIFSLEPGKVSDLVSGPEAWHIFQVSSKMMMPREEARAWMAGRKMKAETEAMKKSAKAHFNSAYFNNPDEDKNDSAPEAPK